MPNRWVSNRSELAQGHARHRRSREGNVAILTALMLTLMMAFVAMSFDIGNLYRVRTEVQSGVDAAALAGASRLDGTSAGGDAAITRAVEFAAKHHVYNKSQMPLSASDFEFGHWWVEDPAHGIKAHWEATNDWKARNAIRAKYTESSVSLPFAAVIGKSSTPVMTWATAVGGGPRTDACGFPIALPDCAAAAASIDNDCSLCLKMGSANADNMAWTSFGGSNGTQDIKDAVENACFKNGAPSVDGDGYCTETCANKAKVGDELKVNNGNFLNKSNNGPCASILKILDRDPSKGHQMFTVKVPVIETGESAGTCGSAKLSGNDKKVTGFALLDIYGVDCGDGIVSAPLPYQIPCEAPANKRMYASLHRENKNGSWSCSVQPVTGPAGGGFFGVSGQPRLVE